MDANRRCPPDCDPVRPTPYTNAPYQTTPDGMRAPLDFTAPPQSNFDTEEMRGSMQQLLADNIGVFVVVEFLVGTQMVVRKQGVLYRVGRSFVVLYDDQSRNFIACDIFSVKFIYFFYPEDRPRVNYNQLPIVSAPSGRETGSRR